MLDIICSSNTCMGAGHPLIEIALLMPIFFMWWKYNSKKNKAYLKDVPLEIASDA